jgi:3-hydroxyisobutyrate dehydrogenase-like beta-hydroxyacid dehydrogenase
MTALRVGVLGTGEMGRPLLRRLVGSGQRVTAYTRRPEVREELMAAGIETVESIQALAASCDVVLIYVYSDQQVREVVLDDGLVDAMAPGSTIVIHTTCSPRTVEGVAARAVNCGVAIVDAPGSGGPAQVAAGTLTLFAGGAAEDVGRCLPLLRCYAEEVVHVGPIGSGQKVKLLNNLLFGAHVELAIEAARLSEHFGIEPSLFAKTLHNCSGTSYGLDLIAAMGSSDALIEAAGRFIYKDVLVARTVAKELDVALGAFDDVTTSLLERTRLADHPHSMTTRGERP